MEKTFIDLGVSTSIIKAIEKMGFTEPTDVQKETIPHVLNKKDLIIMSKTGSGKTGAFGIPLIQQIDSNIYGPQCLILAPTRELVVQVDNDLKMMSKYMDVNTTPVYGQHSINVEIQKMKKGVSIVTGTPGRVLDHIRKKTLRTKNIKFLVLDEADRMLDMGFIDQVTNIIKMLPRQRVTLLFSATMPSEIKRICKAYMNQPVTIELESDTKTVDTIKQVYYRMSSNEKNMQLNRLLKVEQPDSCIIFCNTRFAVDRVNSYLLRKGYVTASLHGGISQNNRLRIIKKFKNGNLQIIVATDIAARGLHIDNLSIVINYDLPIEKDSYVHRIGRTGRAGNRGKAITLITTEIMSLYEIEEHVGVLIEEKDLPTDELVKECISKANGKWSKVKQHKKPYNSNNNPQKSNINPKKSNTKNNKSIQHTNKINENTKKDTIIPTKTPVKKKSFLNYVKEFIKGKL